MKTYTKNLLLAVLVMAAFITKAQTYTWTGAVDTDFENPGNWNPTPPLGYPSFGESALFDGTVSQVDCVLPNVEDFVNLTMNSSYTGTVDASGFDLNLAGTFNLQGGTFIAPSTTLNLVGNLVKAAAGNFVATPGGCVQFELNSTGIRNISGNITFDNLIIATSGITTSNRTMNFSSSGSPTCAALYLQGNANPMAYRGTMNVTSSLAILGSTTAAAPTNTGSITFVGAGNKSIAGTTSPLMNPIGNMRFNTSGTLDMTGNIAVAQTWSVMNIGAFTAGTSTVTMLGGTVTAGSTSTAQAYFDNLATRTGSTTVITGSSWLDLSANLTHNGTLTTNTSLFKFTGSASHAVNGAATLTTLNAIEKSGTGGLSFSHATNLLDSIRISGGAVTLTNLTLKSTSSLKGRIAEISGGGSVSGNVTVETFIPGGNTDWANLGASGVSGLTFNSWYGQIPMAIEGSTTGVTSTGAYFESVWRWDETDAFGYDSTVTVTDPINPGEGYWVYVGNGPTSTTDILTTVTGPAVSGSQPLTLTNSAQAGSCLLANPFASPISWDRIDGDAINSGVTSGAIYIYNAQFGGTSSYAGGVTVPGGSGAQSTIPMGQGFYVEATGAGNLTINENHKVSENTGADPLLKMSPTTAAALGNVIRLKIQDVYGYYDEAAIRFHSSATNGFDRGLDANKYWSSPGYSGYPGVYSQRTAISTQSGGKDYSINSLPYALTSNAVIPVRAKVLATGQHTISASDLSNLAPGTCVTLKDKLLNVTHNLAASNYVCTINDTTSAARFELTICANLTAGINNTAPAAENVFVKQDRNGVYVDLNFEKNTRAYISANNILGQELMSPKQVECTTGRYYLDVDAKEQVIMVNVITDEKRHTQKLFVERN